MPPVSGRRNRARNTIDLPASMRVDRGLEGLRGRAREPREPLERRRPRLGAVLVRERHLRDLGDHRPARLRHALRRLLAALRGRLALRGCGLGPGLRRLAPPRRSSSAASPVPRPPVRPRTPPPRSAAPPPRPARPPRARSLPRGAGRGLADPRWLRGDAPTATVGSSEAMRLDVRGLHHAAPSASSGAGARRGGAWLRLRTAATGASVRVLPDFFARARMRAPPRGPHTPANSPALPGPKRREVEDARARAGRRAGQRLQQSRGGAADAGVPCPLAP